MPVTITTTGTRSPRYPRVSLATAIDYVRRLYNGVHRSGVDVDTAVKVMGFAGKSGASAVALGALRQFGLVDGLRGSVQVSDLALRILEPSSPQEELEARREAAFTPDIYDKLLGHFGGELPRSDEPLRAYLIRTMSFSKTGAEECISVLRRTLSEVSVLSAALELNLPGASGPAPPALSDNHDVAAIPADVEASTEYGPVTQLIRIPLSKDCNAELRLVGEITPAAIQRLLQYIELMAEVWAEE